MCGAEQRTEGDRDGDGHQYISGYIRSFSAVKKYCIRIDFFGQNSIFYIIIITIILSLNNVV